MKKEEIVKGIIRKASPDRVALGTVRFCTEVNQIELTMSWSFTPSLSWNCNDIKVEIVQYMGEYTLVIKTDGAEAFREEISEDERRELLDALNELTDAARAKARKVLEEELSEKGKNGLDN